jgi:RHO1 GDP-GTP exchange protein 1/2
MGGLNTVYAETAAARAEWKAKLEEAIGLRKVVQESNKVFEIETLSADTFLVPSMLAGATTPSWNHENSFTGKVTCSVPFGKNSLPLAVHITHQIYPPATGDGRALVAIGCAEGVWIGFRHDSRCKSCNFC